MQDFKSIGARVFRSRMAGDIGHLLVRQFGIKCFSFFAVSFAIRQLGPLGLGELGYAMAVGSVLIWVVNLGLDTLIPKAMAEAANGDGRERVAARYYSLRLSFGVFLLPIFIGGWLWEVFKGPVTAGVLIQVGLIWMASYAAFIASSLNPQPYAQGIDDVRRFGNAQFISSIITSILFLLLMPLVKSPAAFVFIQSIGMLFVVRELLSNRRSAIDLSVSLRAMRELWPHIKTAGPLILNVLVCFGLYTSDSVFLAFMSDRREVGLYTSAMVLVNGFNVFISVLPTVIYPRMLAWNQRSSGQMLRRSVGIAAVVFLSVPLAYVGLRYFTPILLPFILGNKFEAAAPVLAALVCCFLVGVSHAIIINIMVLSGRMKYGLYAAVIGACAGLVCYPYSSAYGGASGVAHAKLAVVALVCIIAAAMVILKGKVRFRDQAAPMIVE